MRFPRIVAAQRLQTWLLVVALVSIVLIGFLVVDLTRNLQTVVISETEKSLNSASRELAHAGADWLRTHRNMELGDTEPDRDLERVSYEVLRSYPDVEGGYVFRGTVVGHSFPSYTEPGSTLRQPSNEREEVLAAILASRESGRRVIRSFQDGNDLVVVSVTAHRDDQLAAWCLRRLIDLRSPKEPLERIVLVLVVLVALVAIGVLLRLSFSVQRSFATIQTGLDRLRTDVGYRLPEQDQELSSIVRAINVMAEDRQSLEAELRREDRLRVMGRVVAGIAHEIRNPLNSIRLTIRVLARRLESEPQNQELAALVTSEVDRLDTLLKSLLVFRTDNPERLRQQPLQPILSRTIALVKPHAQEHGVALQSACPEDALVYVDGDYLHQALMNLLLNAIDASPQGALVSLSAACHGDALHIDVEDFGPGLSPEQQEHLFEAFYTTKVGGTGLGLAVTRTLLEKMGGRVEALSGGHGGSVFRVTLPVEKPA